MPVPKETILHLARLSRLSLTSDEITRLSSELGRIVDYFELLKTAEVGRIDPGTPSSELQNVLREDVINASLSVAEALKNAPETKDNFYAVPRVIE